MTTNNLAKWVDEIAGTIERIQKKITTFKVNTVEVDPVAENTGLEIADITVNGEKSTLKMPDISVTPVVANTGDKIADFAIKGESTALKMPALSCRPFFDEGTKLATVTLGNNNTEDIYMPQDTFAVSAPTAVQKREIANVMGTPIYEAYIKVSNVTSSGSNTRLLDASTGGDLYIGTILEFDATLKVEDTTDSSKGTLFMPVGSDQSNISFQLGRVFAGITKSSSLQSNLMVGYQAPSEYVGDFLVKIIYSEATV